MACVVVIGAGVGGLAAALRLCADGHDVVVYEAKRAGGKLASTSIDGFTFDTGPSLLTFPDVIRELFAYCDRELDNYVTLIRLEHPFRHRFADGRVLDTFDEPTQTRHSFETFGAGEQWDAMFAHTRRTWEVSERSFFVDEMVSALELVKRLRSPLDLLHIDAIRTLDSRSRSLFDDSNLRAWMNRFATYSGSSPYKTPATLACIAYIEQHFGAWHVQGGLGTLADSMVRLAREIGVEIIENTPVVRVLHDHRRADAIVLASGERIDADVIVSDINAERLYSDLIPGYSHRQHTIKSGRSTSVLALCLGLDGSSSDSTHHNLWYSKDQKHEFHQIFNGPGVADDPTIYMCNPSVSDASMAPEGSEAWFGLVNVRAGATHDWDAYADRIVEQVGIEKRVRVRRLITPGQLEHNYGDSGGAIYGTSSNGRQSAFLRARNRGPVDGLYLCGGSAHPGGGIPLVAMSGRIVADMVKRDLRK